MDEGRPKADPWRVAFENGHEAIIIAQDGVFRAVNPAAERLSGYPREQMVGRAFLDVIHPEDHAQTIDRYQRRLAGDLSEQSMTVRLVRADGDVRWLEAHSVPVDWEGRPAVLAFLAEVTERETERRRAAERERMLQRVAELSPNFIFIYDYELGRDVYINRSVAAALGYDAEQEAALQPYPFARLCHPDDIGEAMDRDARWVDPREGQIDAVEFRLRDAAGRWRTFRSLNTPFRIDGDGRVRQILGVCEDVTERRAVEEALRRTERIASLGVLASGLAHDFGNLLTPVLGRAELLLARLPAEHGLRHHAEAIRQAALSAAEMVDDLLTFSGRRGVAPRPVDLNRLVREVVDMLAPSAPPGARLALDLAGDLPPVTGDHRQLRQVILNLVVNAFDAVATVGGGAVRVATVARRLASADLARLDFADGLAPGAVALLEVRDEGIGMTAEARARLWEPFFTTKPQGRGLGLASVLGILRAHGAGIGVESAPGRGTTFRVFLAEAPADAESPPRAAAAGER
jgi:PAS domain S-box-containing protein